MFEVNKHVVNNDTGEVGLVVDSNEDAVEVKLNDCSDDTVTWKNESISKFK